MRDRTISGRYFILLIPLPLAACDGRHSWLSGAGQEAATIETLFWPLLIGAGLIWLLVMSLAVFVWRTDAEPKSERKARSFILWGGAVFPTVVVTGLLVTGLFVLRAITGQEPDLTIRVDAEQWWWRVIYETPAGEVVSANEVRLPVGKTVEFILTSDDVIHSFWVPALGGKVDMIPGRETRLKLTPVKTGNWGGLCAEYCGGAHAQMRFSAVVMEEPAFEAWLAAEAAPAGVTEDPGLAIFTANGCDACHTVRGTVAEGPVGPDLTHMAGRTSLGAGLLPMDEAALRRWITATETVKPGAKMPAYPDLPEADLAALTSYLMRLK